ncbi:hypothetical protein [Alcanivorax sp.]|uniref:hypothetical protein n=1 Tax=Alcanivorax sp. TaxID=1872427 RepID=UPI003A8E6915
MNVKQTLFIALSLLSIWGCSSSDKMINSEAILKGNVSFIDEYQESPYVKSENPHYQPGYTHYNAMTAAITYRNKAAVEKLVDLGASRKVVIRYYEKVAEDQWPVATEIIASSSAELACITGDIEITDYLLAKFPDETFNYSRCLYFNVAGAFAASGHPHEFYRDKPWLTKPSPVEQYQFIKELISRGANVAVFEDDALRKSLEIPGNLARGMITQSSLFGYGLSFSTSSLTFPKATALVEAGLDTSAAYPWWIAISKTTSVQEPTEYVMDLANAMLVAGADPNLTGQFKVISGAGSREVIYAERSHFSLLHLAAYHGNSPLYISLLQNGANPSIKDSSGRLAPEYSGHEQRWYQKISDDEQARKLASEKQSSDVFGKALAIGIGAAAVGSLDIDAELSAKTIENLATDVLTESGGAIPAAEHYPERNNTKQQPDTAFSETSLYSDKRSSSSDNRSGCVENKRSQYPGNSLNNKRQRCFPIAATCWNWGSGESAVYEYCSEDSLRERGVDVHLTDKDKKHEWDCGGSRSTC